MSYIENKSLFFTGIAISQVGVVLVVTGHLAGGAVVAGTGMAIMVLHVVMHGIEIARMSRRGRP